VQLSTDPATGDQQILFRAYSNARSRRPVRLGHRGVEDGFARMAA
jgi:hypothetical protein